MEITPLPDNDVEHWIDLRQQLWPDYSREDLAVEIGRWEEGKTGVFVARHDGALIGFAEVAMHERAPGCTTSPVGYLEGWWVAEDQRARGVGRALLEACEEWARRRGAAELASDAPADNELSRRVHAGTGFTERRPVARFHKAIGDPAPLPVGLDATVTLREIDRENVRAVVKLEVAPHQRGLVAPNGVSLAEYAVTTKAWTRAIYADEEPVGYVLLSDDDEQPRYYLWRYMIDHRYQGLGFGRRGMDLIIEYVRGRPGADGLYLSYVPGSGSPEGFYKGLGFVDTGRVHGGEVEAYLEF